MPTVNELKDGSGWMPLLLACFTFQASGSPTLLVSTHPLDGTSGPSFPGLGILPAGNYVGRIAQQDIEALQQRSQQGIDRMSQISLHLFDADHSIWNTHCYGSSKYGFRGASVQLALVMWQPGTSNFSSDAPIQFIGTCDMEVPTSAGDVLAIQANNSHNTGTIKLPMEPIQNRCPWMFPSNAAERAAGVSDPASPFYRCGYGPDQGGCGNYGSANHTDGYGNQVTDGAGLFVMCDFIRSNSSDATSGCMARLGNRYNTGPAPDGDLMHDTSGRATGRFGGIEWSPGTYYAIAKNYTSNSHIAVFSFQNSAVLGQYQNLLYGTQRVTAKLANVIESGNDSKCEAMVCDGDVGPYGVLQVIANGIQLNRAPSGDNNLWWDYNNTGGRNGSANPDSGYGSASATAPGDPYGSICCLRTTFYKDIFTGFGVPTIQVLASGPQLQVYSSSSSSSLQKTSNPAWVFLDLLTKCNWRPAELNIDSFIAAAAFCDAAVSYQTQTGATSTHARFKCQFVLEQRRSASEVLAAVLRCFRGYSAWEENGLLGLYIGQSLADSQPSPIPGSNYNSPVASITASGGSASGYVAYSFDPSNCTRTGEGDNIKMDVEGERNQTVLVPNQWFIQFQDEDNDYVVDSLGEIDAPGVQRAGGALQPGGGLIPETLDVLGISNFDQAVRVANVYSAERQYGNERNDASGTRVFTIGTTVRCSHLRGGHLVRFSWPSLGISNQLFRVLKISPATNYSTCKLTLQWHNDLWYEDVYGQAPQAFYSATGANRPQRAPHPWQPFSAQPYWTLNSDWGFGIAEVDTAQADDSILTEVRIYGAAPVNQISPKVQPPLVPVQATVSGSGGSIPGGITVLIRLCAMDSDGGYSAPSAFITAAIPAGGSSNSITINNIGWGPNTYTYDVFAGYDHYGITHQAGAAGSPTSSITLTSLPNTATYAPPDLAAATIYSRAKTVVHGGILGQQISAETSSTVTLANTGGSFANNLAGYKLVVIGRQGLVGPLPEIGYDIVSNSDYVLTLSGDPTSFMNVGDLVLVCARANIHSPNTIGDANFVNPYATSGVSNNDVGCQVRIIAGKGQYQVRDITDVSSDGTTYTVATDWTIEPDSTSLFIVEEKTWRYQSETTEIATSPFAQFAQAAALNVSNYAGHVLLVQCLIGDPTGTKYSNEFRSPWRMIYIWGQAGSPAGRVADGYYTVTPDSDDNVTIDLGNGLNQRLVLSDTAVTVLKPVFTGGTIAAGSTFTLYVDQDATGNRASPTFASGHIGDFVSDMTTKLVSPDADSRTAYQFTYHPPGLWGCDYFSPGLATS